jgi:hypothetical protein
LQKILGTKRMAVLTNYKRPHLPFILPMTPLGLLGIMWGITRASTVLST